MLYIPVHIFVMFTRLELYNFRSSVKFAISGLVNLQEKSYIFTYLFYHTYSTIINTYTTYTFGISIYLQYTYSSGNASSTRA